MGKQATPDGGRYTRPRRGFRAPSHYRERLAHRGQTSRGVKMEALEVLRKRQGTPAYGASGIVQTVLTEA